MFYISGDDRIQELKITSEENDWHLGPLSSLDIIVHPQSQLAAMPYPVGKISQLRLYAQLPYGTLQEFNFNRGSDSHPASGNWSVITPVEPLPRAIPGSGLAAVTYDDREYFDNQIRLYYQAEDERLDEHCWPETLFVNINDTKWDRPEYEKWIECVPSLPRRLYCDVQLMRLRHRPRKAHRTHRSRGTTHGTANNHGHQPSRQRGRDQDLKMGRLDMDGAAATQQSGLQTDGKERKAFGSRSYRVLQRDEGSDKPNEWKRRKRDQQRPRLTAKPYMAGGVRPRAGDELGSLCILDPERYL